MTAQDPGLYSLPRTVKRTITLDIAGSKFRMTADAEETHLTELASMINDRVAALGSKAARTAPAAQLLAVVALGLADDLLAAEKRCRMVEDVTRRAVASAIERIDRRLEADAHAPQPQR